MLVSKIRQRSFANIVCFCQRYILQNHLSPDSKKLSLVKSIYLERIDHDANFFAVVLVAVAVNLNAKMMYFLVVFCSYCNDV